MPHDIKESQENHEQKAIVDKSPKEPGELGTERLFLLNEGRIPDSFALKGSSFECVLWQTSV